MFREKQVGPLWRAGPAAEIRTARGRLVRIQTGRADELVTVLTAAGHRNSGEPRGRTP